MLGQPGAFRPFLPSAECQPQTLWSLQPWELKPRVRIEPSLSTLPLDILQRDLQVKSGQTQPAHSAHVDPAFTKCCGLLLLCTRCLGHQPPELQSGEISQRSCGISRRLAPFSPLGILRVDRAQWGESTTKNGGAHIQNYFIYFLSFFLFFLVILNALTHLITLRLDSGHQMYALRGPAVRAIQCKVVLFVFRAGLLKRLT